MTNVARPLTVVGFAGSLNENSSTKVALEITLAQAATHGVDTKLLTLGELRLPVFDPATTSAEAESFASTIYDADALVWASPLYHGSMSGAFKNALDWLELLAKRTPPYLSGRPVGLIATSGGGHALQAIVAMEHVVRALRGWTVPMVVPIERASQALQTHDERALRQLRLLGDEIADAAVRFRRA